MGMNVHVCLFLSLRSSDIEQDSSLEQHPFSFRNIQSSVERKIPDIPDDSAVATRRPLSRIEDLIDKRKSNRGLTPTGTPHKKRSQS